jgi:hypothetical protein
MSLFEKAGPADLSRAGAADPEEEVVFSWSDELQAKLARLSAWQRNTILLLVVGQVQGYSWSRFLKSSRSCRWCGLNSLNRRRHEQHEPVCRRRGKPWHFAITKSRYYGWMKDPLFAGALRQAHDEALGAIIKDAFLFLKAASLLAAVELRRQVVYSRDEGNRQRAAIAILDRAGVERAAQSEPPRQLSLWLEEVMGE